ncbi:glycerate kinase [Marivirga sericea]|uniref:Glycerate kinase n=1 Tax=Marivirga sericea TaxID=1028 RepID=A0A1X7J301_9BACT|nr:glycerate kinase [Marivirga sericea]SMG21849.1 glycerate kinase [Marivirga sericea]
MKILIAPDKFKHSLTAEEVCEIISETLLEHSPKLEIECLPMADGGEGSAEILALQQKAEPVEIEVHDPLMRKIKAHYFITGKTAYIEMAVASGLQLLKAEEQNVLQTTSFGTGELIKDAIKEGCLNIVLCIGGSATSDGGVGMANALGFRFLDENGDAFLPTAYSLDKITSIEPPENNILKGINFSVLTDVNNPLTGKNGATYQYAIQKGATERDLPILDDGMKHLKNLIKEQHSFNIDQFPGAGASGGMGGGSTFFLHAALHSGISYIAEALNLDDKVKNADYIISGEGKLDEQSFKGKVVSGVLSFCQKHGKPLFLIIGCKAFDSTLPEQIHKAISLTDLANSQEDSMKRADHWLRKASEKIYAHFTEPRA